MERKDVMLEQITETNKKYRETKNQKKENVDKNVHSKNMVFLLLSVGIQIYVIFIKADVTSPIEDCLKRSRKRKHTGEYGPS